VTYDPFASQKGISDRAARLGTDQHRFYHQRSHHTGGVSAAVAAGAFEFFLTTILKIAVVAFVASGYLAYLFIEWLMSR
jgi:hypothetical protein